MRRYGVVSLPHGRRYITRALRRCAYDRGGSYVGSLDKAAAQTVKLGFRVQSPMKGPVSLPRGPFECVGYVLMKKVLVISLQAIAIGCVLTFLIRCVAAVIVNPPWRSKPPTAEAPLSSQLTEVQQIQVSPDCSLRLVVDKTGKSYVVVVGKCAILLPPVDYPGKP